jgi:hypothetical protein
VVKITCSVNTSTWAYEFVASVNNVQIGTTGSVPGSAGFSHFSVRFVRSGGAFSLYYRVPTAAPQDPSTEGDWVQLGATTAYAPTRPGGQVATGVTSSAVYAAEEFYSKSSSPVPATATGPQWRIGSLATLPAGEPLVEWYLGPETVTANLYALHEHDADGDVVFTIGQRDVFRGILQAEAETGGSEPGLLSLVDAGGVANYLWVANTTLRISQNTKPATPDAGFAIGPLGYGGIYVTAGAAPQPTNATPGTFDVVTGFTTNYGPSQFVAPDAANDRVTAAVDGDYFVEWHVSLTGDAANPTTYTFAVFSDGVEVPGSRGAVSTVDASTLVDVMGKALFTPAAAGDQVDLRVAATEASADVTPVEAQLVLMRLGG